jgi:hypothetical protein
VYSDVPYLKVVQIRTQNRRLGLGLIVGRVEYRPKKKGDTLRVPTQPGKLSVLECPLLDRHPTKAAGIQQSKSSYDNYR